MLKKIIILFIIIAAVAISIYFFVSGNGDKTEYVTSAVEKGNLVQTVSEVGTVKAFQEIELNFLQAGKVAKILVSVGDKVEKDQVLAELDYGSLSIKEKEALANLNITKSDLNKLLAGVTQSEIAVSQANVTQQEAAYSAAKKELVKIQNTATENISQAEKNLSDLDSKNENDITPYEQAVITAEVNLKNTKSTYQRSINNKKDVVITTIDDKLTIANTALDTINRIVTDSDAKDLISVRDFSYLNKTEDLYDDGLNLIETAEESLEVVKNNKQDSNINQATENCTDALNTVYKSLNYCYSALENSVTSSSFTQAELDSFKSDVSTQLTTISTGISVLQTAWQNLTDAILTYETEVTEAEDNLDKANVNLTDAINTAKDNLSSVHVSEEQKIEAAQTKVDTTLEALQVAKAQLIELKSPPRIEDLSLYNAKIKQAEASLELIKKQIEDSIIKAPIEGTVVKIEYEVGEQISAAKPAIHMLSQNNFEVEVDISEADIAKVKKQDKVEITLDAFGEDVKFLGRIYFIEPAETVIQDVIYYKVNIQFIDEMANLDNIKPGMTANAVVTTASRENVLIMPSRAIIEKNGGDKYVRILTSGQINETQINIGLRGDEGMVEVLSGVKEGDEVVTYVKNGD